MPTGIARQMFARVLMLGNIVFSISLVVKVVTTVSSRSLLAAGIGICGMFSTLFGVQEILELV